MLDIQRIISGLSYVREENTRVTIEAHNVTTAVLQAMQACLSKSAKHVSPRGKVTRERFPATITITRPYDNICALPARNLNYSFMMAEWMWMMTGLNDASIITPFNKNLSMALDPDALIFNGAYGPPIAEQIEYVIRTLRNDELSRQAIINIWRNRPGSSKDIPCTLNFQFMIRDKKLHLIAHMRSNDVWLGLPYDLFNFTQIQAYVARVLNMGIGTYTHFVGSLHLYEDNVEAATECVMSQPELDRKLSKHSISYLNPTNVDVATLLDVLVNMSRAVSAPVAERNAKINACVKELIERHGEEWKSWLALLAHSKCGIPDVKPPVNSIAHFVMHYKQYE